MKSQTVRLIDIFALAPFMIWVGATKLKGAPKTIMIVSGAMTLLYNADNYLKIQNSEIKA